MASKEELELVNEELEEIFQASFAEIFVTDQNGVVLRVNSVCEENYGLSSEEIIGKHVKDLEKQGIFYPSATLKVIEKGKPIEILQETGFGRFLHVQARPIMDKSGYLKRVISYSRDLTELSQLKRKIEEMEDKIEIFKKELQEPLYVDGFITKSQSLKKVMALIQKIAKVNSTVLILGETGVGKSKFARLIHSYSDRETKVFNEINCAALPPQLIESELFGYEGGSFTGAFREGKKGLIELSNQGTLFLDEIGEIPLEVQGKLLQVLQEKKVRPVGSNKTLSVDVRIISATNKNLEEMVEKGQFRKDLFYRLNVIPVYVPPLRERKEDIFPLVYHFLDYFNRLYNSKVRFSPKVLDALLDYRWDGNIRELENIVERLVVTGDDIITLRDLPAAIRQVNKSFKGKRLSDLMADFEKSIIEEAYERHHSSYKVAEELGISQSAATRKIKKYIHQPELAVISNNDFMLNTEQDS